MGLDKSAIDFATDQVIKLKSERVYTYTRSRIKWHLSQGHKVIFISGSPDFLVKKWRKNIILQIIEAVYMYLKIMHLLVKLSQCGIL